MYTYQLFFQSRLEQEMSVFEIIGQIQSCSAAAFELLQGIGLIERSGSHVRAVDLIHHRRVSCTQTQIDVRDSFRLGIRLFFLIFLVFAKRFFLFGLDLRLFLRFRFLAFSGYFGALRLFGSLLFLCHR